MFVALDKNNGRVFIDDTVKGETYLCPVCKTELRVREGEINTKHFSHKSLVKCDDFEKDMSEWHKWWQEQFPEECREIIISHENEIHRADVLFHDTVIEFQHSPISSEEFERRNKFYNSAGYRVAWIFDMIEKNSNIVCVEEDKNNEKYQWKLPVRFLKDFIPQDLTNVIVFFN